MEKVFEYKIGDQVWLMHKDCAVCATVTKLWYTKFFSYDDSVSENEAYSVSVDGKPIYDSFKKAQLFLTKADLVNSL